MIPGRTAEQQAEEEGDPGLKDILQAELDRLAGLPKNWDSYGAPALDPAIIAAARSFVRVLPENLEVQPRVVPMSPGNLQMEWHRGTKVLELEFENPDTIRYLKYEPDARIEEEDSFPVTDTERAVDLIHWFARGMNGL